METDDTDTGQTRHSQSYSKWGVSGEADMRHEQYTAQLQGTPVRDMNLCFGHGSKSSCAHSFVFNGESAIGVVDAYRIKTSTLWLFTAAGRQFSDTHTWVFLIAETCWRVLSMTHPGT